MAQDHNVVRIAKARISRNMKRRGVIDRPSSFPFVSGDTFRAACDIIVETDEEYLALAGKVARLHGVPALVFSSADFAVKAIDCLASIDCSNVSLIVHNGDIVPAERIFAAADQFRQVFSVNWLLSHPSVTPIPIGLENAWHKTNGRFVDYQDALPGNRGFLTTRVRDISVLSAFSNSTNRAERQDVASIFADLEGALTSGKKLRPAAYRSILRRSKFVISPPGNGPDCHRTWEAIYTGAIPVVLRRAWPFHQTPLPVFVVNDWREAAEAISADADGLYEELSARPPNPAYFMHYAQRLFFPL